MGTWFLQQQSAVRKEKIIGKNISWTLLIAGSCLAFNGDIGAAQRKVRVCKDVVQECWKGAGCEIFRTISNEASDVDWSYKLAKNQALMAYQTCMKAREVYSEDLCQRVCKIIEGAPGQVRHL